MNRRFEAMDYAALCTVQPNCTAPLLEGALLEMGAKKRLRKADRSRWRGGGGTDDHSVFIR